MRVVIASVLLALSLPIVAQKQDGRRLVPPDVSAVSVQARVGGGGTPTTIGLATRIFCVDTIVDQANGGCLEASSTPTFGVLFPYPGTNNVFDPSNNAFVGGGERNQATGGFSTVGGGRGNTASGGLATIGGGSDNTTHFGGTVGGGSHNTASGSFSTVGGGGGIPSRQVSNPANRALGAFSTVGGGRSNTASTDFATVGGGHYTRAAGHYATVGGGSYNTASGGWATVGGGGLSFASGLAVPGEMARPISSSLRSPSSNASPPWSRVQAAPCSPTMVCSPRRPPGETPSFRRP